MSFERYVFHSDQVRGYRFPTHRNDLVIDRAEAVASEVFWVVLDPGEAPPLHVHHDTEQVFFVTAGRGELRIGEGDGSRHPVATGDVVRVPPGTWHAVRASDDGPLVYLSVDCFPGGRPAEEPSWDAHIRAFCAAQGWDFDEVRRRGDAERGR